MYWRPCLTGWHEIKFRYKKLKRYCQIWLQEAGQTFVRRQAVISNNCLTSEIIASSEMPQPAPFRNRLWNRDTQYCSYQPTQRPHNSTVLSAAYMRKWIESAFVEIMACHLFGAKPLSKVILAMAITGGPHGVDRCSYCNKVGGYRSLYLILISCYWQGSRDISRNIVDIPNDITWPTIEERNAFWTKTC